MVMIDGLSGLIPPHAPPASMLTAAVATVSSEMSGPIATYAFIAYALFYTVLTLFFIGVTHYIIRRAQTMPAGLGTGAPAVWPGVSLIRPVYGADENSESCFRTCLEQDYPGPVEYLFCLQRNDDPALPLLHHLRDEYTQRWAQLNARMRPASTASSNGGSSTWRRIVVLVHPVREGFNGKTSNMFTGQLHSSEPIVVFQDSDLVLESKWFIRQTVMALRNYDCVYSPTRWIQGTNVWARIYAFVWNLTMLTLHCTCTMMGSPLGLAGPTMAMPRRVLDKIGGVEPIASFNCEDLVLGVNLMKQGFTIGLGPLVSSPVGEMMFGTMFQNLLRGVANVHRAGFKSQVGVLLYDGYIFGLLVLPFVTMTPTLIGWIIYFCLLKQIGLMGVGYVLSGEFFVTPSDIIIGEVTLLFAFFKVLVVPTFRWGGQLWHVDIATARMSPLTQKSPAPAPTPAAVPLATTPSAVSTSSPQTSPHSNASAGASMESVAMLPPPPVLPTTAAAAAVTPADLSRAFVSGYVLAMIMGWSFTPAVAAVLASATSSSSRLSTSRPQQQLTSSATVEDDDDTESSSAEVVHDEDGSTTVTTSRVLADDADAAGVVAEAAAADDDETQAALVNTTTTTTTTTTTIVRTPLPAILPGGAASTAQQRMMTVQRPVGVQGQAARARGCSMQDAVMDGARAAKMAEHANRCVHDHVLRLRRSAVTAGRLRSSSAATMTAGVPPMLIRNKHVSTPSGTLRLPLNANAARAAATN